jgi:hypothetical protein
MKNRSRLETTIMLFINHRDWFDKSRIMAINKRQPTETHPLIYGSVSTSKTRPPAVENGSSPPPPIRSLPRPFPAPTKPNSSKFCLPPGVCSVYNTSWRSLECAIATLCLFLDLRYKRKATTTSVTVNRLAPVIMPIDLIGI